MKATQLCRLGDSYVDPLNVVAIKDENNVVDFHHDGCKCRPKGRRRKPRSAGCVVVLRAHMADPTHVFLKISSHEAARKVEAATNALHSWEKREWARERKKDLAVIKARKAAKSKT